MYYVHTTYLKFPAARCVGAWKEIKFNGSGRKSRKRRKRGRKVNTIILLQHEYRWVWKRSMRPTELRHSLLTVRVRMNQTSIAEEFLPEGDGGGSCRETEIITYYCDRSIRGIIEEGEAIFSSAWHKHTTRRVLHHSTRRAYVRRPMRSRLDKERRGHSHPGTRNGTDSLIRLISLQQQLLILPLTLAAKQYLHAYIFVVVVVVVWFFFARVRKTRRWWRPRYFV